MRQKRFNVGDTVVVKIDDHLWEPCTVVDAGGSGGHQDMAIYRLSHGGSIVWAWENELFDMSPGSGHGARR
jgi:hypothetical protein